MAPRRNSSNNGGSVSSSSSNNGNNANSVNYYNNNNNGNKTNDEINNYAGNAQQQQQLSANPLSGAMSPMPTPANTSSATTASIITNGGNSTAHHGHLGHHNSNSSSKNGSSSSGVVEYTRCCYPNGECCRMESLIALDDQQLSDCVRVVCNNENCNVGQYMHRDCFELWEQSVLVTLKANGRARSWSERQRVQNLWTKKGYDLVYKACGCKCGRGHLRKDLDWTAPPAGVKNGYGQGQQQQQQQSQQRTVNGGTNVAGNDDDDDKKKSKKKRNRNNQKPTLTLATLNGNAGGGGAGGVVGYQQQQPQQQQQQLQNGSVAHLNGNVLAPNPNVGVIGSGLPHNNNNGNGNQNGQSGTVNNNNNGNSNALISNVVATLNTMIVNGVGSGGGGGGGGVNSSGNVLGLDLRTRAGSLSSSGAGSGSTSPSVSQSSIDMAISPMHQQSQQQQQQQQHVALTQQAHMQQQQQQQQQQANTPTGLLFSTAWLSKSILNGIDNNSSQLKQQPQGGVANNGPLMASIANFKTLTSFDQQQLVQQQKNKEVELHSERVRSTSGCNGIFSRRLDFSSFNMLPKTRLNSYQVKIEDEGNHGNDETRLFILSSLAQSQMSRVACILCEVPLLVFDRYPLVDGSFFLSPKQHSTGCIEVKYEGRSLYLTCVCMSCLDGTSSSRVISCRFCNEPWDGSNLVLGTMYAYDIFAAMPCCAERFKCNNCFKLLMHPQQRLSFYSDYSHGVTCPYCNTQDTHFVKSLSYCYIKSNASRPQPIA